MSTSADPTSEQVSAGIVAFTGWGKSKAPVADASAVEGIARAEGVLPEVLLEEVVGAVTASEVLATGDLDPEAPGAGDVYRELLRTRRPDLGPAAIDALTSRWLFRRVWLGADTPAPTQEGRIRYFALFIARGRERVPRALLRRRYEGDVAVDEVLRDVDEWAIDDTGSVDKAVTRYLDSDLDEISAAQAAEFQRMVADRTYRPFSDDAG